MYQVNELFVYVKKVNACAAVGRSPTLEPAGPFETSVVDHCKQNPSAGGVVPPQQSKFHSNVKFLL